MGLYKNIGGVDYHSIKSLSFIVDTTSCELTPTFLDEYTDVLTSNLSENTATVWTPEMDFDTFWGETCSYSSSFSIEPTADYPNLGDFLNINSSGQVVL